MLNARSRIQHHGFDTDEGGILMTWCEAYLIGALIKNWPVLISLTEICLNLVGKKTCKQLEEEEKSCGLNMICCMAHCLWTEMCLLPPFVFGNAHALLLVTFCSCFLSHTDAPSDEGLCKRPSIHRVSDAPLLCLRKQSVWAHLQSGSGVRTSGRNVLLSHLDCGHTHRPLARVKVVSLHDCFSVFI